MESLGKLLTADLNARDHDPFHSGETFSSFVSGLERSVKVEETRLAVLLPEDGSGSESFGVSVTQRFDLGTTTLRLGLSATHEAEGFVGIQTTGNDGGLSSQHAAATFDWSVPLAPRQELTLSGSVGVATPAGSVPTMTMHNVSFNSLKVSYGVRDIFGSGDRFSVGFGLPEAVQTGRVDVELPVALATRGATFEQQEISLAPDERQFDLSLGYGIPISRNGQILLSATRSLNDGNIAGRSNTIAAVGFRFQF